jgi:hypothetical protein
MQPYQQSHAVVMCLGIGLILRDLDLAQFHSKDTDNDNNSLDVSIHHVVHSALTWGHYQALLAACADVCDDLHICFDSTDDPRESMSQRLPQDEAILSPPPLTRKRHSHIVVESPGPEIEDQMPQTQDPPLALHSGQELDIVCQETAQLSLPALPELCGDAIEDFTHAGGIGSRGSEQVIGVDDQEVQVVKKGKRGKKGQRAKKRPVSHLNDIPEVATAQPPPAKRQRTHLPKPPMPPPLQTRSAAL